MVMEKSGKSIIFSRSENVGEFYLKVSEKSGNLIFLLAARFDKDFVVVVVVGNMMLFQNIFLNQLFCHRLCLHGQGKSGNMFYTDG